jgi:putative transposase
MTNEMQQRHSIRLKGYDYSQKGFYFITICTQNRECLFGEIVENKMMLNNVGKYAKKSWNDIPLHFPHVKLDVYCIMPNHIHGILNIFKPIGAKDFLPQQICAEKQMGTSKTIGSIIRGFKIGVTKWIRKQMPGKKIWQRNYYEHIIRNENDYYRIYEYIENNHLRWEIDSLHPCN